MAKIVVKSKTKKIKRKFPVELKAPESFNNVSLGKSNFSDLKNLVGRTVKMNLMYITKNIKNQNVRILFKIVDVDSGEAKTEIKAYEQIPYYLKRFVKSNSDLVEDSFVCESKDGKKIRIKPFLVTKKNTTAIILSDIRLKIRDLLQKEVSKQYADEFVYNVAMGRIQLNFRNKIKKIFPLKAFEFKKVIIED